MINVGRDEKAYTFESRAFGGVGGDHDPDVIELEARLIGRECCSCGEQHQEREAYE
jgi:hypothetical protein